MGKEEVLLETVRTWAEQTLPGEPNAAERAAVVALVAYRQGGSIAEACRQARGFVVSWSRHPSHLAAAVGPPVPIVS